LGTPSKHIILLHAVHDFPDSRTSAIASRELCSNYL